ncbi:MAG TPA: acetylglutamate kinase [Clostridiaceae bacterium]|nr:acetylglutamate kinase [Clostridiaceae bacterium]
MRPGYLYLNNLFRSLWEQHADLTRLAIISIVFDLPIKDHVIKRLLRNPEDFKSALEPYYGNKTASQFANLLAEHLTLAAQLVEANKSGDKKSAKIYEKKWYENASNIASFLSCINPCWSREEWEKMLFTHLDFVKAQATNMLTKDYAKAIAIFDPYERQVLEMADIMSMGIIRQFPYKFVYSPPLNH